MALTTCSGTNTNTSTTRDTTCGAGDAAFTVEGRSSHTFESARAARVYELEVPAGYDGTDALPVILDFHGFGSNGPQQADYSELGAAADAVVVTPTGLNRLWNLQATPDNPDLAFVRDLVAELDRHLCLDHDRIYATGISNGSAFSALLACYEPDLIAAIAMVAGTGRRQGCATNTMVPTLDFHGTADPVASYAGGPSGSLVAPVMESLGVWARSNGCEPDPTEERITDDVVLVSWSNCAADVEHYRIEGGGHTWPGAASSDAAVAVVGRTTASIDASDLVASWFLDHHT